MWLLWLCVLLSNTILKHQNRQHFHHLPSNFLVMHRENWNSLKITGHRPPTPMISKKTSQWSLFFEFISESSLCTKVMLQTSLCLASFLGFLFTSLIPHFSLLFDVWCSRVYSESPRNRSDVLCPSMVRHFICHWKDQRRRWKSK